MIPLILGAVALGTAAVGAMKGSEGIDNMNEAKKIGELAQKRRDHAISQLEADWKATNKLAEEYGQLQLKVKTITIGRFVAFIERIGQRASQSELQFLEGLNISTQQIEEYKTAAIEAEDWVKGSVSAVVAGAAAGSSAVTLARSVGTVTVTRFFGLWATAEQEQTKRCEIAAWERTTSLGRIVSAYTEYQQVVEQERTKRQEIDAWEKETIAKINAQRDLLMAYLDRSFDERAENFRSLFCIVDRALAAGNNEHLALALHSITEIAKSSPFKELANLASVRAALDDPGHEWTF